MLNELHEIIQRISMIDMQILALQEEKRRLAIDLKRTCPHDGVEYALGKWIRPHPDAVDVRKEYYAVGAAYCRHCDSFFAGNDKVVELASLPTAVERSISYLRHIGNNVAGRGDFRFV